MRHFTLVATLLLVVAASVVNGQSTAQAPSSSNDYYFRGLSRETQGDFDGAIADFTRAIELDESALAAAESKKLKAQLAETYYYRAGARRDIDGTLADLDRAISLNPGYINAYRKRASVRQLKNDPDGAKSDLERARTLAAAQDRSKSAQAQTDPKTQDDSEQESTIPINSKIYVADSGGFQEYLGRAIRDKKMAVVLVKDRGEADFEIRGGYSGGGSEWAGGGLFPIPIREKGPIYGHVSVISMRTGYRVWAAKATESDQKRLANKLVGALKKKIETDAKTRQTSTPGNSHD
jgi:tetratricopeptide (TPR) repeat protein